MILGQLERTVGERRSRMEGIHQLHAQFIPFEGLMRRFSTSVYAQPDTVFLPFAWYSRVLY